GRQERLRVVRPDAGADRGYRAQGHCRGRTAGGIQRRQAVTRVRATRVSWVLRPATAGTQGPDGAARVGQAGGPEADWPGRRRRRGEERVLSNADTGAPREARHLILADVDF